MTYNNFNNNFTQTYSPSTIPLIFVNGIEGAKSYILSGLNQTVYLKDNSSDLLFIKYSDNTGMIYFKTYHLVEDNPEKENPKYISEDYFNSTINELKRDIERLAKEKVDK